MRRLRFKMSGHLIALSLRVMPASRIKTMLMDFIDDWYLQALVEMHDVRPKDLDGFRVTRRYR